MFYAEPEGVDAENGKITISREDSRHLAGPLRLRRGDIVVVGDGEGSLFRARLISVSLERAVGSILSIEKVKKEAPAVMLLQSVGKVSKMDGVLVGAAESGVESVVPLVSSRSPSGSMERSVARLPRWRKKARESSRLSRRAWPLEVKYPRLLSPWAPAPPGSLVLVLWEKEKEVGLGDLLPDDPPGAVMIAVGPEGGFSPDEIQHLKGAGALTVRLGPLNIRTESAGIYAAMIVRHRYGLL